MWMIVLPALERPHPGNQWLPLWVISPGSIRTWDFGPASTWLHLTSSSFSYCYLPLSTASPLAWVVSLSYNRLGFFCQGTGPVCKEKNWTGSGCPSACLGPKSVVPRGALALGLDPAAVGRCQGLGTSGSQASHLEMLPNHLSFWSWRQVLGFVQWLWTSEAAEIWEAYIQNPTDEAV